MTEMLSESYTDTFCLFYKKKYHILKISIEYNLNHVGYVEPMVQHARKLLVQLSLITAE